MSERHERVSKYGEHRRFFECGQRFFVTFNLRALLLSTNFSAHSLVYSVSLSFSSFIMGSFHVWGGGGPAGRDRDCPLTLVIPTSTL